MGLFSVRQAWPLALALVLLPACAESPTPTYARPPAPYGYPLSYGYAPAYGYGAMACGTGPAMVSNASGYAQAPASYGTSYGQSRQVYAPVFCPVGYGAGYAGYPAAPPASSPSPALWTWSGAGHSAPSFGSTSGSITVYTSVGCGPCKNLQHKLSERNIPFVGVDVDQNREAYLRAQVASGGKSGVPLTDVNQGSQDVWILGDDADAVERAYRQN